MSPAGQFNGALPIMGFCLELVLVIAQTVTVGRVVQQAGQRLYTVRGLGRGTL